MSTVVYTCIYSITCIMYSMLLRYVLYCAFVRIVVYIGEIDFSIISSLKSQVSPRIACNYLMHSRTGSHFLFFTSTCMPHLQSNINCRYFLCRLMYLNSTTPKPHEQTVCCCFFVEAMTDCCCCLLLSDRSCLCS